MSSVYFAIACILMVLAIFWGSTETEPKKLSRLFGPRAADKPAFDMLESQPKKKPGR
jgi:hypothetical protein